MANSSGILVAAGAVLTISSVVVVAQQSPISLQRAPETLLDGRTLVAADRSFSIEAPGVNWEWFMAAFSDRKAAEFVCADATHNLQFVLTVFNAEPLQPIDRLVEHLTSEASQTGRTVRNLHYESSSIPLPGSYSFTGSVELAPGYDYYWRGYIWGSDRVYVIQSFSLSSDEPDSFAAFVRSFRPSPARQSLEPILVYLILSLIILGATAFLNNLFRRSLLNGGLIASVAIGGLVIVGAILGMKRGASAATLGRLIGEGGIVFVLVFLLGIRRSKRVAAPKTK